MPVESSFQKDIVWLIWDCLLLEAQKRSFIPTDTSKKILLPTFVNQRGFRNLGNTCYLNSCIQILSHTYELNDLLSKDNLKMNNNNDSNIKKK